MGDLQGRGVGPSLVDDGSPNQVALRLSCEHSPALIQSPICVV